jgi:hypothetical protein
MLFVLAAGAASRGSRRWIDIGIFTFQPSEFGKVLFVLALAGLVADRARGITRTGTVLRILAFGLAPIFLVFIQPDIGTALVYAAALAAVLFIAGVRWLHLGILGLIAVLTALAVLGATGCGINILKPYQAKRLTAFTQPATDPQETRTTCVSRSPPSARAVCAAAASRERRRRASTPVRARDRLRVRVAVGGARVLRRLDPLAALPARRLARVEDRRERARSLLRDRRRWNRLRFSFRCSSCNDDGHRTDHRHPAAVRLRRRSSMITNLLAMGILQAIYMRRVARRRA